MPPPRQRILVHLYDAFPLPGTGTWFSFNDDCNSEAFFKILKNHVGTDTIAEFQFVDLDRNKTAVVTEEEFATFVLWAKEMIACGKGLFVRIAI